MNNKIVLSLIALILIVGLYLTLSDMYISNSGYNGYKLLISATIASLLMFAIREPIHREKVISYTVGAIFYFLTFILAIISLFSSPTDKVEPLAGAIVYVAGSLFFASSFAIPSSKNEETPREIGTFHKYFRYFLLLLLILEVLNMVYTINIIPFVKM